MTSLPIGLVIDLTGTFVFGLSGGMLAVRRELDLFGVVVLSMVAALAGGVIRDAMLGATPAAALSDSRYLWCALAAGLVAFVASNTIDRLSKPVMVLDAIGLGFFAVSGCAKALSFGLSPVPAILLGVLTGVGGGTVRDVLVAEIPRVLREEVYAFAALIGATMVVVGHAQGWPPVPVAIGAIAVTVALRIFSVVFGWRLPRAPGS